jgi:hypothetical protein
LRGRIRANQRITIVGSGARSGSTNNATWVRNVGANSGRARIHGTVVTIIAVHRDETALSSGRIAGI